MRNMTTLLLAACAAGFWGASAVYATSPQPEGASTAYQFIIKQALGVTSANVLATKHGPAICLAGGSPEELKVYDYFSARNGVYSSVVFSSPAQVIEGLGDGKCDVALFNSALVPEVLTELNAKDAHIVLPEMVE